MGVFTARDIYLLKVFVRYTVTRGLCILSQLFVAVVVGMTKHREASALTEQLSSWLNPVLFCVFCVFCVFLAATLVIVVYNQATALCLFCTFFLLQRTIWRCNSVFSNPIF